MGRIVLATSGSCGDVHPYIAVAMGLRDLGHEVCVAAPEYYRAKIEGEGLTFAPIRPDFVPVESDPKTVRRAFNPVSGAAFLVRKLVLPSVEETYQDLLTACTGADLLLIHPLLFPAPLVAEKLGLKWISIVLSPIVFVSAWDPPILPPLPWMQSLRGLGPLPHRVLLRVLKGLTRGWMRPLDKIRRREGLNPVHGHPMHDDMFSPFGTLAWFSSKMGPVQPDWPARTEITGFPVYDREEPLGSGLESGLEPELRQFLAAGDAPAVFTLGSSAVVDARDFYEESRKAVEHLGCRAVFVVGRNSPLLVAGKQLGDVFITGYAPFSELFPLASLVVHQGGIGTTGQALAAGLPMLVVPLGLDQPDNAARAARLGVALVLPRRRYRAASAAKHLKALMSDPAYGAAARRIGAELRAEDGITAACSAIERILYSGKKAVTPATVALPNRSTLREAPVPAYAGNRVASQAITKLKR